LLCKARWDYYQEEIPMITDVKTTQSAKPENFARDIFTYGYYQQAAFYSDGYRIATGIDIDCCFALFVIEKTEPYVCSAYELGLKSIEAGRMAYRRALDTYAECVKNNYWPSYTEKITMIDIPNWAMSAAGIGQATVL